MRATPTPVRTGTALLLLVVSAAHAPLVEEHLHEAPYVGWLFLGLSLACAVLAALVLLSDRPPVWLVSATVCLAAVLGFVASRTVGLPQLGDEVGNWTEPLALPAILAELLVVAVAAVHLRPPAEPVRGSASGAARPCVAPEGSAARHDLA